jgi:hypothetical protein
VPHSSSAAVSVLLIYKLIRTTCAFCSPIGLKWSSAVANQVSLE